MNDIRLSRYRLGDVHFLSFNRNWCSIEIHSAMSNPTTITYGEPTVAFASLSTPQTAKVMITVNAKRVSSNNNPHNTASAFTYFTPTVVPDGAEFFAKARLQRATTIHEKSNRMMTI